MAIYALDDRVPTIDASAYVHPDAVVIGMVEIGAEATIWPHAVLRGDYGRIVVGARTSVQDGTVVHATHELATVIGSDCVIGHNTHLEGCRIEDHSLVGSGSIVLHRCVVGPHSLVGANAVVTNGTVVPPHAQALGIPAKIKEGAVADGSFAAAVALYVDNGKRYRAELRRLD
ncbi:MAG TPA: gamma carbonic anhydrase family protein [Acidimicrobiales bacterium]|nr:gamma carbonic anhydrase family protein [Acidimicrobiales bacterium]